MPFVIDASLTMSWCFEDEEDPHAERALDLLRRDRAHVPAIWVLAVAKVPGGERRGRLTDAEGIQLRLGLYRPERGRITYHGVSVGDIAPQDLAANCAAVFQDFARFPRPLGEEQPGSGDGRLRADDAALRNPLDVAGFGARLAKLPVGLDTSLDPSLGEPGQGAELSRGEWECHTGLLARSGPRHPWWLR